MMEAVKTLYHKGIKIAFCQDEDYLNPDELSGGDENVFLVNYHRDFQVEMNDIITEDNVRNWYQGEKIKQSKEYHIFALSMYSHSGVCLSLNHSFVGDGQGWDTSHVGVVMISKKEMRLKKKAEKIAEGLVKNWNDALSGNVYRYVIDDNEDGCWGFYGDIETSGIIEEAKAEAETIVDEKIKKHLKRLKAYIKNGVSLNKREALKI